MQTKLLLASTCALVSLVGALSLARPAAAAPPPGTEIGCSLQEFEAEIKYAHQACRAAGYDGGTVTECGKYTTIQCWNL